LKSNGNGAQYAFEPVTPIVVDTLMTPWDWSSFQDEHFVQFYEQDDFIVDSLCQFVTSGLEASETVVVAATDEHLNALNRSLSRRGVDVVAAITTGNYVTLSAETTLTQLKSGGEITFDRFNEVIGGTILQTRISGRRVRVFGELVALLCAEGNIEAAVQLEDLWNQLKLKHPFSLFCAYPMQGFDDTSLNAVCGTHAHVIPAESFTTLPAGDSQSRAITVLQQKAIRLESEIHERVKAEEYLRVAKEELEKQVAALGRLITSEQLARAEAETANRMKDEFLATVSHELRTPLNAIIGWTHMMRRGHLDDETKSRALETIERNAKSQAQLVEDLLDVSRMVSGKLLLKKVSVDVASVINAAIDAVQLAASSKDIELQVTLDPYARHVLGDASRLQQIVWNLLSNAIKFTPSGGRVNVYLERRKSNIAIRVTDTGQGIAPEFLPYVFERFRQADGGSTRRHGGLGLGLALVRHLAELHGGTIQAISEGEGQGATFIIELPSTTAEKNSKPAKTKGVPVSRSSDTTTHLATTVPATLKGRRVFLVDDDPDTLQMLSTLLGEQQAEVQTASSTEDAMEMLHWYQPHVIVMDLAMPGEDGFSLIQRIRRHEQLVGRTIPALALTAQVRIEDRARALSAGFNMFVAKPVEAEELIAAISNLTEDSIRVT
jgi:signal transduction histidine kinase